MPLNNMIKIKWIRMAIFGGTGARQLRRDGRLVEGSI